jgi:hypothetical protein
LFVELKIRSEKGPSDTSDKVIFLQTRNEQKKL